MRVADLIRGKKAGEAMVSLQFMPYRAAAPIRKVLRSAMANAEQKNASLDVEGLWISEIFVGQGPTLKRMLPRSMGRANVIKKRSSHITVCLAEQK